MWIAAAALSAVFAGITTILSKCGIKTTDSDVATALRTTVVLVVSWIVVWITGSYRTLSSIDAYSWVYLILSGLATGASWLCYYYAIAHGQVSVVVPMDKLSILITILFSVTIFKEKLSKKSLLGLVLLTVGTLAMAIFA